MANRLVLNGLQSIEAVYIPNRLTLYGLSTADSLRCYGVLTGMVLPLLLFPSAITSSVSVLLLPYISEAQAVGNHKKIRQAVKKMPACLSAARQYLLSVSALLRYLSRETAF